MPLRFLAAVLLSGFTLTASAQSAPARHPKRPLITGVSHIALYTSDPAAASHFYREILGAAKEPDPENPRGVRYALNATQFIEVLPLPAGAGIDRLDHIAWNTTNAEAMRRYLAARGWKTPARVEKGTDGSRWFTVLDPEGNKVQFVEPPRHPKPVAAPNEIGNRIIHFGFMVHSRAAEDTFYRGLLDFRPYWAGGRKPGEVDYVSQQVPNGRDWLEYMLTSEPGPGIPAGMTRRRLGSMDHFSIGEVSVPEAYKVLEAGDRLTGRHDKAPHIGAGDGKYQLNLYDPDDTRVELMNYHSTVKPDPPFTAADPTPNDKWK
ncbi:MAG: VOC family protein [Terracidiphilus sp.]